MTLTARILCRVVDNFGDAGVCWRFARQLAGEHGWRIRLTIDRPGLLERLGARTRTDAGRGSIAVEQWPGSATHGVTDLDTDFDTDVLVSAFGADPPPRLRASLAGAPRRPLWVNLEYLSAEDWVDTHHGLSSTKPADGAIEHFYYPGYGAHTGGLLRERALFARRDTFVSSPGRRDWLARWKIDAPADDERVATLFCYPQAPLAAWFAALANGAGRWRVLVPEGVADAALSGYFGHSPAIGRSLRDGNLVVQRIPFLPQDDYDRLLWSADLNLVRGEDSWVRAQWAARPFLWQPYRQEGGAQLVKLRAFLRRAGFTPEVGSAMRAWSGDGDWPATWRAFESRLDALRGGYARWTAALGAQDDLCTRFVDFCVRRL